MERDISRAKELLAAENWQAAISIIEQLISVNPSADLYADLIKCYRRTGFSAEALSLSETASSMFPKHRGVEFQRAELLYSLGDFDESAAAWIALMYRRKGSGSEHEYLRLIQSLRGSGDLFSALKFSNEALTIYPCSVVLLSEYADLLLCIGEKARGLEVYGEIFASENLHEKVFFEKILPSLRSSGCLVEYKEALDFGRRKFGADVRGKRELTILELVERVAGQFGTLESLQRILSQLNRVYVLLSGGNFSSARRLFSEVTSQVSSEELKEKWLTVFDELCRLMGGDRQPLEEPEEIGRGSVKKVFIGGLGWSGAGALKDYLCEFEDVVEIPGGELQIIAGPSGLKHLVSAKTFEELRHAIIEFFKYNVVGLAPPRSFWHAKEMQTLWAFKGVVDQAKYLDAVAGLFREVFRAKKDKRALRDAISHFIDDIVIALRTYKRGMVVVLENVINIENVELITLFNDARYYAVVRDPRSLHCTRCLESPRYHGDWQRLVKEYREKVRSFDEKTRLLRDSGVSLTRIYFEDLVFDEGLRRRISEELGLDYLKRRERTFFKPEDSQKNALLHTNWEDEEAIQGIYTALKEYCLVSPRFSAGFSKIPS